MDLMKLKLGKLFLAGDRLMEIRYEAHSWRLDASIDGNSNEYLN